MWGRDKNFQVLMLYKLRNCENKISLTKVFGAYVLELRGISTSTGSGFSYTKPGTAYDKIYFVTMYLYQTLFIVMLPNDV